MSIKNIVFDVGDVLIEYRWRDMLKDYGVSAAEAEIIGRKMFDDPLWHELDVAIMTKDEVIEKYKEKYPEYGDTISWFIRHGEYMNVGRPDVWEYVKQLKIKGYSIYLLSNYSEDLFKKHTKDAWFMDWIDGKVVSYENHLTKPDEAIYKFLLEKYKLKANECLFLDDRIENVKTAKNMGFDVYHVTDKDELLKFLKDTLERK